MNSETAIDFSFFQQIPVGVCITDPELNIVFWNRKLENWTNKLEKYVVGEKLTTLYPHLNKKPYINRIKQVAEGGPSVVLSSQLHPHFIPSPLPDGKNRIQSTTITRNSSQSIGEFVVITIQDITDTHRNLEKIKQLRKKALDEITERERIQQELLESREMLASINRNINVGLMRMVPSIGITYANSSMLNLLQIISLKDILGTNPLSTHISSENKSTILERIKDGDRYINEEVLLNRSDGSSFWAQLNITTTINENKEIKYIDCLISDITLKKAQLERIKKSEEQFRNLFQNSMVGMYRMRFSDGKIVNINRKGLEIFGFDSIREGLNHILYKKKNEWIKLKSILEKRLVIDEMEVQLRRKNGEFFWASVSAKYYPKEGYIEGVVININERREAELIQSALYRVAEKSNTIKDSKVYYAEIHAIVNELMDARNFFIAEYNETKNIISFPYLVDRFDDFALPKKPGNGLTEYVMEQREAVLLNADQITELKDAGYISIIGSMCEQVLMVPLKIGNRSTGVICVQSYDNYSAFNERDKEVLIFVAQNIAATLERKRYENSLLEAKNIAEAASKSKSQFLANMSHELRTPLNSIIGFTRRVIRKLEQDGDEKSTKALKTVQRNSKNLLHLINDVLDLSKIEAGKLTYSIKSINISQLIESIIEELEPLASQKKILLVFDEQDIDFVKADPMRLRQVIINIVGNAIKFTDKGSVTIKLDTKYFSNRNYVCVSVVDSGIGIKEDKLSSIFEVFEQVNSNEDINRGGTGLGLAISRKMMMDMGGDIEAKSTIGKGSTFNIFVPIAGKNEM